MNRCMAHLVIYLMPIIAMFVSLESEELVGAIIMYLIATSLIGYMPECDTKNKG